MTSRPSPQRSVTSPDVVLRTGSATLRFYLGDCLGVLSTFEPQSVSAVVTSPPYNPGIRYSTYDDRLPRERSLAWSGDWVRAVARDLAVGHCKPINSDRFVNDCHEFIFHFTPTGRSPPRPSQDAGIVPALARSHPDSSRGRSVSRSGQHRAGMRGLGVDFVGIDVDRGYVDEAIARVRAFARPATGD